MEESSLPFTPTNTARRSKIGYFGIAGENFNDLWPLFAGVVGSVALGIAFATDGSSSAATLVSRLALCASPTVVAYGYLRLFVHERPPHFRGDLWSDFRALRVNFTNPPELRLPCWPLLEFRSRSSCTGSESGHPLVAKSHEE
jgi:hypothetical protein